jgi:hypothetical protein
MNQIDDGRSENFRGRFAKRAQNLATLDSASRRFRLGRLGMEWAPALRGGCFCFKCANRAMIRDRDPRSDRNRNDHTTCRFNRRGGVVAQTFSSRSMMGAIGPDGILSGGTTSGSGPVDLGAAGTSCLIRVAINMALKSNAAAT